MKKIVILWLLFFIYLGHPLVVIAQENESEELTEEQKKKQQEIEDHGFWSALYEIFLINRLILSNDYSNFQNESGKLEEFQDKFRQNSGANFYARGYLLAPDFWPRVFRRDVSHAEQFPAIEFVFPLKELDGGGYELSINTELLFGQKDQDIEGRQTIGCLTRNRLNDIVSYINKEHFKGKSRFEDDDEVQQYLDKAYQALFDKLQFYIKSQIEPKSVCVGEKIDLGKDLVNFKLNDRNKTAFHWRDPGVDEFDGLVWKTALKKETVYILTIKDADGSTCERNVKIRMKEKCEPSVDPALPSLSQNAVTCVHPVSHKTIVIDPGVDQILDSEKKKVVLGNPRPARFAEQDPDITPKFAYRWIAESKERGATPMLSVSAGDLEGFENKEITSNDNTESILYSYRLVVEDQTIFYEGSEYFTCEAKVNVIEKVKKGPITCAGAKGKSVTVNPGPDIEGLSAVCFGTIINLEDRIKKNQWNNNYQYAWSSANNRIASDNPNLLTAYKRDIVTLNVTDVNDPDFSCAANFILEVKPNFKPSYSLRRGDTEVLYDDLKLESRADYSVCSGQYTMYLKVDEDASSGCTNFPDFNAFAWTLTQKGTDQPVELKGRNATFNLAGNDPRVELRFDNMLISQHYFNKISASISRPAAAKYGFDISKDQKHISVKKGDDEVVDVTLSAANNRGDFKVIAGPDISVSSISSEAVSQFLTIHSLAKTEAAVPVLIQYQNSFTKCDLATIHVHSYEELSSCLNLVSVSSAKNIINAYGKTIENDLNTKVFNQAVIHWNINTPDVSMSNAGSYFNLSRFPEVQSEEVKEVLGAPVSSGCSAYFIYLVDMPIKTSTDDAASYALYRKKDYNNLTTDLLFLNVHEVNSSEKLLKLLGHYISLLAGLSAASDYKSGAYAKDEKNLMNFSNETSLQLRFDQWEDLRSHIKDHKVISNVEVNNAIASSQSLDQIPFKRKSCSDYPNYQIGIRYKNDIDLQNDASISLKDAFVPDIRLKSSDDKQNVQDLLSGQQLPTIRSFFSQAILLTGTSDLTNYFNSTDLNLNSNLQTMEFGDVKEGDMVINEPGIYKYTLQVNDNYTCDAFTQVRHPYTEFLMALAKNDAGKVAEIVANRFFNDDFYAVSLDDRISAIKLMYYQNALLSRMEDNQERAINKLLKHVPDNQIKPMVAKLCEEELIWTLQSKIDGDNYADFILSLKDLALRAYGINKIGAYKYDWTDFRIYSPSAKDDIKVFPWGQELTKNWRDERIKAEYIFLDKEGCNIKVQFCFDASESNGLVFKYRNCMRSPLLLSPFELIAIQFDEKGSPDLGIRGTQIWVGPAIALLFLKDKKFIKDLKVTGQLLAFLGASYGYAAAEGAVMLTLAELGVLFQLTGHGVLSFEDQIIKTPEGKKFLDTWEKIQLIVDVVEFTGAVTNFPKLLERLPTLWGEVKFNKSLYSALQIKMPLEVSKLEDFLIKTEKYLSTGMVGPNVKRLGDDEALKLAEAWILRHKNRGSRSLDLLVHCGDNYFQVFENKKWVKYTPEAIAKKLGNLNEYDEVRLLSCNAGNIPNELAQRFSNAIHKKVVAAEGEVWVHSDGRVSVGSKGARGVLYEFVPGQPMKQRLVEGSDADEAVSLMGRGDEGNIKPENGLRDTGPKKGQESSLVKAVSKTSTGEDFILGDRIGGEGQKDLYELLNPGYEGKIVGLFRSVKDGERNAVLEIEGLLSTKQNGLPTIEFERVPVLIANKEGELRYGVVLKKYVCEGSISVVRDFNALSKKLPKYISQKTIDDLEAISNALESKQIGVPDLQFLILEDGTVLINDPKGPIFKISGASDFKDPHIADLLDVASHTIHKVPYTSYRIKKLGLTKLSAKLDDLGPLLKAEFLQDYKSTVDAVLRQLDENVDLIDAWKSLYQKHGADDFSRKLIRELREEARGLTNITSPVRTLSTLGDDADLLKAAEWLKKANRSKGIEDLLVHSSGDEFILYFNGQKYACPHRTLAGFIKSDPLLSKATTIRLLSCKAGNSTQVRSLAQDLANQLKDKKFHAADETVWVHADGNISIGAKGAAGQLDEYSWYNKPPTGEVPPRKSIPVAGSKEEEAVALVGKKDDDKGIIKGISEGQAGGVKPVSKTPNGEDFVLGDPIGGNSAEKDVYKLLNEDYKDKVIGILKPGVKDNKIKEEIDGLIILKEEEFPTIVFEEKYVIVVNSQGVRRPAIIMKKYVCESSKDLIGKSPEVSRYVNKRSLVELEAIKRMLEEKKIEVEDLQFLILDDGSVLIHDPQVVKRNAVPEIALEDIDIVLNFVSQKVHGISYISYRLNKLNLSKLSAKLADMDPELTAKFLDDYKFTDDKTLQEFDNNTDLVEAWRSLYEDEASLQRKKIKSVRERADVRREEAEAKQEKIREQERKKTTPASSTTSKTPKGEDFILGKPVPGGDSGAEKDVYELLNAEYNKEYVIAIYRDAKKAEANVKIELAGLSDSHGVGLPTIEFKKMPVVISNKQGQLTQAIILRKYVCEDSKNIIVDFGKGKLPKYVNEKTITDLEAIIDIMNKEGVEVLDLQFLILENGTVLLNDPKIVTVNANLRGSKKIDEHILKLLDVAYNKVHGIPYRLYQIKKMNLPKLVGKLEDMDLPLLTKFLEDFKTSYSKLSEFEKNIDLVDAWKSLDKRGESTLRKEIKELKKEALKLRKIAEEEIARGAEIVLGKKLPSDGAHKEIFEISNDPHKLVAFPVENSAPPGLIDREVDILSRLEKRRYPVVKVHYKVIKDGKPGMVMEKYTCVSSKDILFDAMLNPNVMHAYLNEKTYQQLTALRAQLLKDKIDIKDLQFLILEDGTVLINDPLDIKYGTMLNADSLFSLDKLIEINGRKIGK
jgi:hypothetical protein